MSFIFFTPIITMFNSKEKSKYYENAFDLNKKINQSLCGGKAKFSENIVLLQHDIRRVVAEAVLRRCSVKKLFLEISQNSQESNCARVSFL